MNQAGNLRLALIASVGALLVLQQVEALSLISEKCDPNKVGPDETTVKGGWQAEMFNGLSFRTCGKFCECAYGRIHPLAGQSSETSQA